MIDPSLSRTSIEPELRIANSYLIHIDTFWPLVYGIRNSENNSPNVAKPKANQELLGSPVRDRHVVARTEILGSDMNSGLITISLILPTLAN